VFADIIGISGAIIILIAYFFLQSNKISAEDFIYSFANLIGSSMILISLFYQWNLASAVIEIAWIIISFIGIYKWYKKRYNFKKNKG